MMLRRMFGSAYTARRGGLTRRARGRSAKSGHLWSAAVTGQELINALGAYPTVILGYFVALPALAWILGDIEYDRQGPRRAWDYCYSVLVYGAGIPGIMSAVLIAYTLFLTRTNLLQVNLLVYFLPLLGMGLTYCLIGRNVSFDRLPGFDRLWGLMLLIALSFLTVLIIAKMRILVGFFASFEVLLGLGVLVFLAFQFAGRRLFRK